jgi:virginiamycin B lyase
MRGFCALLIAAMLRAAPVAAAPCVTEYPVTATPFSVTAGPDGKVWFTQEGAIGRLDPAAPDVPSYFPLPTPGAVPYGIVSAPDGNLWFTEPEQNLIGRITPDAPNTIDEFPAPAAGTFPTHLSVGPDGYLWLIGLDYAARFLPADPGDVEVFDAGPGTNPGDITPGADGNMWFTQFASSSVVRIAIDPPHATTVFPISTDELRPLGITSGPDGNIWWVEVYDNHIGRIETTPPHAITRFALPFYGNPRFVTVGADGYLWFTHASGFIGRMSAAPPYTVTPFETLSGYGPDGIAPGPDGAIWFTGTFLGGNYGGRTIGRVAFDTPCCGDGQVDADEQCDDSNGRSYDGCSPTCALEACFTCDTAVPTSCVPITGCASGDGCCPSGCTVAEDDECASQRIPISGAKLVIRDNVDPLRRKIAFVSRDPALYAGFYDPPPVTGAALDLRNPLTGESLCLPLPAANWTVTGYPPTYRYRDGTYAAGPCRAALLRAGNVLKVKCDARVEQIGFSLDEPSQDTIDIFFANAQTVHCARFGGAIQEIPGRRFIATEAPAPASCPPRLPCS